MPTVLTIDYKIAAGWNNVGGLTRVSSIVPTDDIAFEDPKAYGGAAAGVAKIRGDGTIYYAGFQSVVWQFGAWTYLQYAYLQSTYCGGLGNLSGKVTIRTRDIGGSYANLNAILTLNAPAQLDYDSLYFLNPSITFTRLSTAS